MVKLFELIRSGFSLFREYLILIRTYDNALMKLRQERLRMAATRSQIKTEMSDSKKEMNQMLDHVVTNMEDVGRQTDEIVKKHLTTLMESDSGKNAIFLSQLQKEYQEQTVKENEKTSSPENHNFDETNQKEISKSERKENS